MRTRETRSYTRTKERLQTRHNITPFSGHAPTLVVFRKAITASVHRSSASSSEVRVTGHRFCRVSFVASLTVFQRTLCSFFHLLQNLKSSAGFLQDIGVWEHVKRDRVQAYKGMKVGMVFRAPGSDLQDGASTISQLGEGIDILDKTRVKYGEDTGELDLRSWPVVTVSSGKQLAARLLVGADDLDYIFANVKTVIANEVAWREKNTAFDPWRVPATVTGIQGKTVAGFLLKMDQGIGDVRSLIKTLEYAVQHGQDIGSVLSLEPYYSEQYLKNYVMLGVVDKLHKLYATMSAPVVVASAWDWIWWICWNHSRSSLLRRRLADGRVL
ncbi:hypothetical protein FN846DRAFT_921820 [Sphaerosporella brunnea]|uniref:Uncharacterized protein n=1 Tax=Sphaerosporella brunnea TaxID=1250544 RepID=A0A5J5ELW3_9PEZI|nr:hypothetical protein FN846DRAFT_921820 [Sphaerosporella brunnea]